MLDEIYSSKYLELVQEEIQKILKEPQTEKFEENSVITSVNIDVY